MYLKALQYAFAVVVKLSGVMHSVNNIHNSVKLEQCVCELGCGCTEIVHYTWSVL